MGSFQLKLLAVIALLSLCCSFVSVKPLSGLTGVRRKRFSLTSDQLPAPTSDNLTVAENGNVNILSASSQHVPQLIQINALMLFFYSTLGAVMPYLPLYYRKIGISDVHIGVLGAITPAAIFIVSPLWGALADSTGQHKSIMIATFVGSVLLRCLMGYVDNQNVLLLGVIVGLSAVLFAPVRPLLDSATMAMFEDKAMYGKSRLFGQVGFGLGSFMVGPLLGAAHIKLMFLVQALLAVPTTLLMTLIPATVKSTQSASAQKTERKARMLDMYAVLRDPAVLFFFLAVFLMGLSSGIIENFAFVRMSEVSGTGTLAMTLSRLLSSLAGGPMFWLSGAIIKAIGTRAVMVLTCLSYVVRFAMYSRITQAWHAIPAEVLRGVSFALFWSTATTYVYEKSPKGLSATMLGLLNGIYAGLGQSIGSLVGGELVRTMGISAAFHKCAVVDGALLVGYLLVQAVVEWVAAQRGKVTKCAEKETLHIEKSVK